MKRSETNLSIPCQENGWDLSKALNSFFATKCEKLEAEKAAEAARERSRSPVDNNAREAGVSLNSALRSGLLTTKAPEQLTFVMWNIDGLDKKNLK